MYEKKLQDMEDQQKVLENNLLKFLDLKRELSFLQHEAEESDRVVNDFIKVQSQYKFTPTSIFQRLLYQIFPRWQEKISWTRTLWKISAPFKVKIKNI